MTDAVRAAARQGITDLHAGLPPVPVLLRILRAILAEPADRPDAGQKEETP